MTSHSLADLVDLPQLMAMAEAHTEVTGISFGLVDPLGEMLLGVTGWQPLCTHFFRAHPETLQHCRASKRALAEGVKLAGGLFSCRCQNGLQTIGIPITVQGELLAVLFLGQFFLEGELPDHTFFRSQATRCGFDVQACMTALEQVPIYSEARVHSAIKYNQAFAGFIQSLAKTRLTQMEEQEQLRLTHSALQQQQGLLQILVDTIPSPVFAKGADLRYTVCNKTMENTLGLPHDFLVGKSVFDLYAPELAEQYDRMDRALLARGGVQQYEGLFPRKDGVLRDVLFHKAVYADAGGRALGMVGVMTDITEHKAMLAALQASEERYRRIVETASEGIVVKDPDETIRYVNQTMADMIGHAPETLLGRSAWNCIDPRDQDQHAQAMLALRQGIPQRYEMRLRHKLGKEVWTLVSSSPALDGHGEFQGSVCMVADISPFKRMQQILGAGIELGRIADEGTLEDVLRAALDAAEDLTLSTIAFFHTVSHDGKTFHLQSWSSRTLMHCSSDAKGKRYDVSQAGVWGDAVRQQRSVIHNDYPSLAHKKGLPPGHVPLARELVAPIFDKGTLVAVIGVGNKPFDYDAADVDALEKLAGLAWEVVARKHAQEEVLRSKELAEAANRAKSEFLANMSHEIRTPLNGLLGMLQLLQISPLNAEQFRYADMAIQSGKRLTRLLADILDLARIEAGKTALSNESFDLAATIRQVNELFIPTSQQTGVPLFLHLDETLPHSLVGDATRLQQILINLLGNAFKFTRTGSVALEVSRLSSPDPGKVRMLFSIEDTGVGIPDDKLHTLFQPFTQVHEGYNRQHQGAGLGLSICKRLVTLMGGSLVVESEVDVGTRIHFSLTFGSGETPEAGTPGRPLPASQTPGASGTVLIVDDDQTSQLIVQRYLEKTGHAVLPAQDGQTALQRLAAQPVDLVLLDIQLPGMDGLEICRRIRAGETGPANADVPIIAMTAYAMPGDRETFLAAGMNDYIAKPMDLSELTQRMALARANSAPRMSS